MGSLLLISPEAVNPRFHRIQMVIVIGLVAAAAFMAAAAANDVFWVGLGVAGAGCLVGSWAWSAKAAPGARLATVMAVLALLACLLALEWPHDPAGNAGLLLLGLVVNAAASAALLGTATTAMLVGHWYLIAPTMSITPLVRLLGAFFVALVLRMLTSGLDLGDWLVVQGVTPDPVGWLWLAVRWGVGLAGAGLLGWMAWQAARIRSTQSATGILYVVVIFCFFGELTDQLLDDHLRTLSGGA
jgi:hypothetical protein